MELYSLHPMPDTGTASFLELIRGQPADDDRPDLVTGQLWYRRLHGNQSPRPNDLTFGFAAWLTTQYPVFARQALSLSSWEARVDRGSGMLLRPPSRMFIDAGLDPAIARQMPIRIEGGDGMMGGSPHPRPLDGRLPRSAFPAL
ncbi:MAG: hypothetical protein M9947_12705 [Thermomicrobiales bacterium]|nr:hypothetical protein [Thermomicrobiales bacterium]